MLKFLILWKVCRILKSVQIHSIRSNSQPIIITSNLKSPIKTQNLIQNQNMQYNTK